MGRQARILITLVASLYMAGIATPAYAYLDPATGSIILQGIVAAFAAAAATGRFWWHRVKSLFTRKRKDPNENP